MTFSTATAEMLILMAVVLAVVAIAAIQIIGSAKDTTKTVGTQTDDLNKKVGDAAKSQTGDRCINDNDCVSASCDLSINKCN
ncbi:hypothetical protein HY988_07345 [Candidatus Micrarchaeota archaeon]|nr:hypothetical protein [Candidatus Micrarchaeota archaeon]